MWITLQRSTYQLQVMGRLLGPGGVEGRAQAFARFHKKNYSNQHLASLPVLTIGSMEKMGHALNCRDSVLHVRP